MAVKIIGKKADVETSRAAERRGALNSHNQNEVDENSRSGGVESTLEELLVELQRSREELRAIKAKQIETDALLVRLLAERDERKAEGRRKEADFDGDDPSSKKSASRRRENVNERTRDTGGERDDVHENQGNSWEDRGAGSYARENREFKLGDLVLCKVQSNTKEPNQGKMSPNWEGPYQIVEVISKGSFKLANHEGKQLPRVHNSLNLKKYFN